MTINVNGPQGGGVPETTPARDSTAAQRGPAPASETDRGAAEDARGTRDQAEVTESGRRVSEAVRALDDVPVVDGARVEALRQDIDNGRFEVDAERVAERLIAFEDDMQR